MLSNVKLTAANVPHKESLTTEEKATLWKNISSALIETGRPGIKRLLNWMQSDCGNGVMNYVNARELSWRFDGAFLECLCMADYHRRQRQLYEGRRRATSN